MWYCYMDCYCGWGWGWGAEAAAAAASAACPVLLLSSPASTLSMGAGCSPGVEGWAAVTNLHRASQEPWR
jgi:hypothetical protein|eukprot:COSAG01_NODE_2031_length_8555_cov_4.407778_3_plen_70_part_00